MSCKSRTQGVHKDWLVWDAARSTKKVRRRARQVVRRRADQEALDESHNDVCVCGREDCCCADYEE
jgi:hypothetical protein